MARFIAIPAFLMLAVSYQRALQDGAERPEVLLWWMTAVFAVACISDGIDGWIARHFNQRTRAGAILDALADKMLMLTAVVTLSVINSPVNLPLWFAFLIILRDFLLVMGALYLHFTGRTFHPRPHWTGKVSTTLQMICISWVLLQIAVIPIIYPVVLATIFTTVAGLIYLKDGIHMARQIAPRTEAPH